VDFLHVSAETVDEFLSGDQWVIEGMLAAYLKRSRIDPLQVAAIQTELPNGDTVFWYGVLVFDENDEPMAVRPPTKWEIFREAIRRLWT
jgi:hypothetical protein